MIDTAKLREIYPKGIGFGPIIHTLIDELEKAQREIELCRDRLANVGETTVAPLIVQRNTAHAVLRLMLEDEASPIVRYSARITAELGEVT